MFTQEWIKLIWQTIHIFVIEIKLTFCTSHNRLFIIFQEFSWVFNNLYLNISQWCKWMFDNLLVLIFQGFRRVYDSMPDICLDVPNAYSLLERFVTMCHRDKVVSSDVFQELPQRSDFNIIWRKKNKTHFSQKSVSQLKKSTVFLCLLSALVHRMHPLSSPKNLGKIISNKVDL